MARPTNTQLKREAEQAEMGAKTCRKCKQVLALSMFGKMKASRDGLQAWCKPCINIRNKMYAAKPHAKRKKREYKSSRKHEPEVIARRKAQQDRARARKYGLTVEEMHRQLDLGCAICGGPGEHLDHDHKTGKFRGVLCNNCNLALGLLKDDPARLIAAAFYCGLFSS